jgi:hypothetical protein
MSINYKMRTFQILLSSSNTVLTCSLNLIVLFAFEQRPDDRLYVNYVKRV